MARPFLVALGLAAIFGCLAYLLWPARNFPPPPPGVLVSGEPADTESVYRRAFYSNYSRSELMAYYRNSFAFPLLTRLNHPPEDAYPVIRDQTRSSWLEELSVPWRQSLYINGFYPTKPTEVIVIDGVHYANKITVRLIPSHPVARLTVFGLTLIAGCLLIKEYRHV